MLVRAFGVYGHGFPDIGAFPKSLYNATNPHGVRRSPHPRTVIGRKESIRGILSIYTCIYIYLL